MSLQPENEVLFKLTIMYRQQIVNEIIHLLGFLRVWNVKSGHEVFTQVNSLVSPPDVEGAPTITQLHCNEKTNHLYVVTFDHNIIVHHAKDFSLVKQVSPCHTIIFIL